MKLVVPAAGKGSRFRSRGCPLPKCLLPVRGETILSRLLRQVRAVGIQHVVLVVGYKHRMIEDELAAHESDWSFSSLSVLHNRDFVNSNNICSIALCEEHFEQDVLIIESDVIFDDGVLPAFLANSDRSSLLIDSRRDYDHIDMKARISSGRIRVLGKELAECDTNGEFLGISYFAYPDSRTLVRLCKELVSEGKTDLWYENAINRLASFTRICAVEIEQGANLWEVDTEHDYRILTALSWVAGTTG